MALKDTNPIERKIISLIIDEITKLEPEVIVMVFTGDVEPDLIATSLDRKAIEAAICVSDETMIRVQDGSMRFWVQLVHGNSEDVISNTGANTDLAWNMMTRVFAPAEEWAQNYDPDQAIYATNFDVVEGLHLWDATATEPGDAIGFLAALAELPLPEDGHLTEEDIADDAYAVLVSHVRLARRIVAVEQAA